MPSKNPAQRLRDIVDNIDAVRGFIGELTFDAFMADTKTRYAVIRALEIISEASRRLPDEIKTRHPEIDWVAVASAGNVYRHEYEMIDDRLIWHTIHNSLAALRAVAASEIAGVIE